MEEKTNIKYVTAALAAVIFIFTALSSRGQEKKLTSFGEQNSKKHYTSFAFGMGVDYGRTSSFDTYIGYELPNYNFMNEADKLSEFRSGFSFFGSAERQVHRNFSLKADYSYFIKSNDVASYPEYGFNVAGHRILFGADYIFPMDYAFLKLGVLAGPEFTSVTKRYGSIENQYTSSGAGVKAEGIFDIQIGKNVAGYINGYLMQIFDSGLKDSAGNEVFNKAGGKADMSGFSAGLRLGVEIFIF